ncbi:MAG TPA: WG repeat-containing protein [Candidatus Rifleibacterium sp.]|nr:WG repeat-containing protein [Candidatus Rifleibacterium sp.]HPT46241.1 WG repeat-containing protein [Candidatus Rifleibacterium sp.]
MIDFFYSLPFAILINPLFAVALARLLAWPLVPAINNLFYEQAFIVMTAFVWLSAISMQVFNLLRHLFGYCEYYNSTLVKSSIASERRIKNRLLAVFSFPFDMLILTMLCCMPVLGWGFALMFSWGHFSDWPWKSRVVRNLFFGSLLAILLFFSFMFLAFEQPVRPAVNVTSGTAKFGLISQHGDWVAPAVYDEILPFNRQSLLTLYRQGDRWGYLRKNGSVVLEPVFDHIGWYLEEDWYDNYINVFDGLLEASGRMLPFRNGDRWGFINSTGLTAVSARFEEVKPFSGSRWRRAERLAACRLEGKWGYINADGQVIVATELEQAFSFFIDNDERVPSRRLNSLVKKDGHWFKFSLPDTFTPIADSEFSQPFPAAYGHAWGFIDINGHFVVAPVYADAYPFKNGFARVRITLNNADPKLKRALSKSVLSIVDRDFNVVAWQNYADHTWFYEDDETSPELEAKQLELFETKGYKRFFIFNWHGKTGAINRDGEVVIPPVHAYADIGALLASSKF